MCSGWQCAIWSPLCRLNGGRCASDACLWRNLPLPCKCEEPQRKGTSKHTVHLNIFYVHVTLFMWTPINQLLSFFHIYTVMYSDKYSHILI